jgi:hypothetical protein
MTVLLRIPACGGGGNVALPEEGAKIMENAFADRGTRIHLVPCFDFTVDYFDYGYHQSDNESPYPP